MGATLREIDLKVSRRRNWLWLALVPAVGLFPPALAEADTGVIGKVKRQGTCVATTAVDPNQFALDVPECEAGAIKRVRALGVIMQGNQIQDSHRFPAGPAPFSGSYTSPESGDRVRWDFRIQLKSSNAKPRRWHKGSGAELCRVMTTRHRHDTLRCLFTEAV